MGISVGLARKLTDPDPLNLACSEHREPPQPTVPAEPE
jgi:hypothetical protein